MKISVKVGDLTLTPADLLVVNLFEGVGEPGGATESANQALDGLLSALIKEEHFEGKEGQALLVHTHGKIPAKRVLVVGLGKIDEFGPESVRRASAASLKKANEVGAKLVASVLHGAGIGGLDARMSAEAIAEGALLAAYRFTKHKSEDKQEQDKGVEELVIVEREPRKARQAQQGIEEGVIDARGTIYARDLVNEPPSHLTPTVLAKEAKKLAQGPVRVSVFDRRAAQRMRFGAFLGVAKGSDEEPQFIHLLYKPKNSQKRVVLIGKGITFDTGGLSIKPAEGMEDMKIDMAGAAAVLGVFWALPRLKLPLEVHGMVAAAENMPSGRALKPGDILTARNGKTIEVLNTDAEGRLTLADALSFAVEQQPDVIIDLATLTGAMMVGLGESVAGLFANDSRLRDALTAAAQSAGELVWPMPLPKEYKEMMKSEVADLKNISGSKYGGAITAALFLAEFVGQTPWAHFDIAGPAWEKRETFPYVPKGGTGFGVRTLLHYLRAVAK